MLAPNPDLIKELLTDFLGAYESITAAAIALQQTQLFPLDPAPDWFNPLQTNLQGAQSAAGSWLTTTGPQVVARVPQAFISFNSRFQVVAGKMKTITDRQAALASFTWLKRFSAPIPDEIAGLGQALSGAGDTFKQRKQAVADAIAAANQTVRTDRDQMKDLRDQISDLYQKISAETAEARNGLTQAATSGASMSIALLAYGFAVATAAGPAFPILAIAAGLASLTYGAVKNAIDERKIVDQLSQIRDLQVQLTEDEQTVALLQGITSTLQTTEDALLGIQQAVDFGPVWTDVNSRLDDLIADLQQPGIDFRLLDAVKTLPAAATAWNEIATMALNIQKAASGTGERWTIDLSTWTS